MASVALRRLSKVFDGGTQALHALDLDVRDGELLVLLGPSGSGKTTVLRCIAGLEEPTSGDVVIGERVVTRSEEHTSELQSQSNLVCRLLLEKKKRTTEPGIDA